MMFHRNSVSVGDRFVKAGSSQSSVWVVKRVVEVPSNPPHARMEKQGEPSASITVSVPALNDPDFFQRLV